MTMPATFPERLATVNLNDSPDCFKMRIFFSLHLIKQMLSDILHV